MRKPEIWTKVPEPGEGKRGVDGHLGYLLRQANVAFRAKLERALADLEVTQPQFAVMTMIAAYPKLSGADLARLSLLTPQTISVIVANLERSGIVEGFAHPVHGRVRCLSLATKGASVLERCKERVKSLEAELTAALSPEEEAVVRRWLVSVTTKRDRLLPANGDEIH